MAVEDTGFNESAASSVNLEISFDVVSANAIVAGCGYIDGGSVSISSIVWDPSGANQSFTQLIRDRENVFTGLTGELWTLESPTPGTGKVIRVTLSTSVSGWGCAAISFTGVDVGGTPFGTPASNDTETGATGASDLSVPAAVGDTVVNFLTAQTASSPDAAQTAFYDSVASGQQYGAGYQDGEAGPTNVIWTKDGGGTQHWVLVGVAVKPAAAPAAALNWGVAVSWGESR